MTWIEERIEKDCAENDDFAQSYTLEKEKLAFAVALRQLREREGLTQCELAELAHKPQSTISRIERGTLNPSFSVLNDIARGVGKRLDVQFI
jgi:predicted transcriptional regulator